MSNPELAPSESKKVFPDRKPITASKNIKPICLSVTLAP